MPYPAYTLDLDPVTGAVLFAVQLASGDHVAGVGEAAG